MRVFMSYASEQKAAAESIAFSLRSRGHSVFLDRDDLPEGASYDDKIVKAIERSDLMIFLISPEAVHSGRYTLTELKFARHKWRSPSSRVLPVMLAPTPMTDVPGYLKAVSILEPHGNIAAEVAYSAERLRGVEHAVNAAALAALAGAVVAGICGLMPVVNVQNSWLPLKGVLAQPVSLEIGVLLAALFAGLYWWLGERRWWKLLLVGLSGLVGWIVCLFAFFNFSDSINILQRPPESELNDILASVTDEKRTEKKKQIDALEAFFKTASDRTGYWSSAFLMALCGLACFVPIFGGMAAAERSFRSMTRLILGLFFALVSGAAGYILSHPVEQALSGWSFTFVEGVDVFFAVLYLPWLATVAALFAYWLVRGQET